MIGWAICYVFKERNERERMPRVNQDWETQPSRAQGRGRRRDDGREKGDRVSRRPSPRLSIRPGARPPSNRCARPPASRHCFPDLNPIGHNATGETRAAALLTVHVARVGGGVQTQTAARIHPVFLAMDVDMNEADALEALSSVLERLTDNPYNIALHAEHIRIARATGMDDQIESALDMMIAFWAAGADVWLPLIQHKIGSSNLDSPQDLRAILDLFARAEQDYLCE